jgi:putative SOS response-associated peptidase YedK
MCARFVSIESSGAIAEYFRGDPDLSDDVAYWQPRYNLTPTQMVRVVVCHDVWSAPKVELMRWGMLPRWQRNAGRTTPLINARLETAAQKPSFREAFAKRRCIVAMTGFYEWTDANLDGPHSQSPRTAAGRPRRQPHLIRPRTDLMLAVAGIWNRASDETPATVAILTTAANDDMRSLHDRMPVLLEADGWEDYLDPELNDVATIGSMLGPIREGQLIHYPVSTEVNSVRAEGPHLLRSLEELKGSAGRSGSDDLGATRTPQLFSDEFGG